jgi:transposase-like protein
MNLIEIAKTYNTTDKCVKYLKILRWGRTIICSKCGSENIVNISSGIGRHHCNDCETTFSVISGTIFEDTRLDLPTWFMIVGMILNAKQGISALEISRDAGITYKTAWYACMRIRCGMIDNCSSLQDVVEMDESYIGGKPRKRYSDSKSTANLSKVTLKRGRGTKKTPVVGIVQRKGKVVLKVVEKLTSANLLQMLKENVKTDKTIVMTDEFTSYRKFDDIVAHLTVNHAKGEYVRGAAHVNTIEGFWSIVKNSIRGAYKSLSIKYLPFYLVQAQYIYNYRYYTGNLFQEYMKNAVSHDKCMLNYKPKTDVKKIVYKKCSK